MNALMRVLKVWLIPEGSSQLKIYLSHFIFLFFQGEFLSCLNYWHGFTSSEKCPVFHIHRESVKSINYYTQTKKPQKGRTQNIRISEKLSLLQISFFRL